MFKRVQRRILSFIDAKGKPRIEIIARCSVASARGIYDNGISSYAARKIRAQRTRTCVNARCRRPIFEYIKIHAKYVGVGECYAIAMISAALTKVARVKGARESIKNSFANIADEQWAA